MAPRYGSGAGALRYKLEGLDRDWQDVGNRRQAFYTNLPQRHYRFRVAACNNSGVWNEASAFLDFSIAPAYYQTNWFRGLCTAAFLALLWGLYQIRIQQVRRQERKLRDVIETVPTFAWTALPDGSVDSSIATGRNTPVCPLSEQSARAGKRSFTQKTCSEMWEKWRTSLGTGEPFEDELRYRRAADGRYRRFLSRAVPLRDHRGKILKWYGISTDIEDRKRAEEERERLRQAQSDLAHINRVTTVGELTASLAHEVNQPIAAAVTDANTCLRWLNRDQPDIVEAREAALRVMKDATRAAEIVSRTRLLFKKASSQSDLVDVNEIIREMVTLLRSEAMRYSITVRTELTDLPPVMGDRVQLQQVLMNLVSNSIDAMNEVNGTRELAIRSQRAENAQVMVSVTDTGVGLPPQQASRIFNAFFTTKVHGTGMGLSISRSIVASHNGRLWAADNSPHGASFHFILPTEVGRD